MELLKTESQSKDGNCAGNLKNKNPIEFLNNS